MNRTEFLRHSAKTLGTVNVAVEVGVWRGDFSNEMISVLKPQRFYGVDPYRLHDDYGDCPDPVEYANQQNLDALYERVQGRYNRWTGAQLLRTTGVEAAQQFEDHSLDLVYIDGDHSYEFVSNDIRAWWPKIRPGGILSGHDYTPGNPQKDHVYGVIQAVDEHCDRYSVQLHTTDEQYATWWCVK